jgi:hypothetical protein
LDSTFKLEAKGITGKVKRWIKNWLKDRSHCVVLGDKESESSSVESGMPQGTILGPYWGGLVLEDMFERANDREGARTRQTTGRNNLKPPAARTEIRKNSFAVRAVKDWNELPDELKSIDDVKKFKKALRKHRD